MNSFYFKHPTTIMVVGPTGSGKTEFVSRAIEQRIFNPMPERKIWIYGERQEAIESRHSDIEFIMDGNIEEITDSLNQEETNMLVIDDQMCGAVHGDKRFIEKLFTQGSHHKNLTVILIVQNLFAKELRTISLNTHYFVLLKNSRDRTQIRTLGQQMFPDNPKFLVEAFDDATRGQTYGYLIVDSHPQTEDDSLRIVSRVLQENGAPQTVYLHHQKLV